MYKINHDSYPYSVDLFFFDALSILDNEDTSEDIFVDSLMNFPTSS